MKTIYVCGCGFSARFMSLLRIHQAECGCHPLVDELRSIPE